MISSNKRVSFLTMTFISGFKSLFLRQKPQNVKFCGFFVLSGVFTEHQQTNNQSIKEK